MVWASVNSLKLCQLDLLSVFTCHHWQSWLVSSAVQILQSTGSVFVLDFFGSGQWESCDTVKQTSNTHPIFHLQPGCKHLSAWGVPRCCFVGVGKEELRAKQLPLLPGQYPEQCAQPIRPHYSCSPLQHIWILSWLCLPHHSSVVPVLERRITSDLTFWSRVRPRMPVLQTLSSVLADAFLSQ